MRLGGGRYGEAKESPSGSTEEWEVEDGGLAGGREREPVVLAPKR